MGDIRDEPLEHGVAVVGAVGRFGRADDLDELWRILREAEETIVSFSAEELRQAGYDEATINAPNFVPRSSILTGIELFDAEFFGLSRREAQLADPQLRVFLECAWEALEASGYDSAQFPGRVGVFAGASPPSYLLNNLLGHSRVLQETGALSLGLLNLPGHIATQTSYRLNLTGPSVNVQTACSTSLVAVHLACQALMAGDCDMAIAGAVSIKGGRRGYQYEPEGILSSDGRCRPFDADGDGTVFGDGVGILVLRRLDEALDSGDSILAILRGWAVNNDGARRAGYTAPSVEGQVEVVAEAMGLAGCDPKTVSYVEAHGTATRLGDPIEVSALARVYGPSADVRWCGLGSVKSNVGHTDAAAGMAGLLKVILGLRHEQIPATLHYRQPNPNLNLEQTPFYVVDRLTPWARGTQPRRAGVSSFGLGGTNAHVVVEEPPIHEGSDVPKRQTQVILVSARTRKACEHNVERWLEYIAAREDIPLSDLAFTSRVGRRAFRWRQAAVANTHRDAAEALASAEIVGNAPDDVSTSVAFMFPGQGSQSAGMAAELYRTEDSFRDAFDECAQAILAVQDVDLRRIVFSKDHGDYLRNTEITQPAVFAVSYALVRLWSAFGVAPSCMIGHSLGEYVAACVSGVMDPGTALRLVSTRGRLMASLPPGKMAAVPLPADQIERTLVPGVELAAVNGPALCTVAGPPEAIDAWLKTPAINALGCIELRVSHAFHSAMMEPILERFGEVVSGCKLQPPTISYVSNVTGTWITPEQATSAQYYVDHIRRAVLFGTGIETMLAPGRLLLEVGPGRTLTSLARAYCARSPNLRCLPIPTLGTRDDHVDDDEISAFLRAAARLWTQGATIDWAPLSLGERRRRVSAPTYPFERRRHWIERTAITNAAESTPALDDHVSAELSDRPDLDEPHVRPRNEIERTLAEIWEEALGVGDVGVNDNFFALGGHSLLATRLLQRVGDVTGVAVAIKDFFSGPTVASLASRIAKSDRRPAQVLPRINPQPDSAHVPFPLTDVQAAYWMGRVGGLALSGVTTHVYQEFEVVGFDVERAETALNMLVARHGMLRAIVHNDGTQEILIETPRYHVSVTNLTGESQAFQEATLLEIRDEMKQQVRPADQFPLWEIRAARLPNDRTRLFVSLDMLTLDAASMQILAREFVALYANPGADLPPIEISFRDYVLAEQSLRQAGMFQSSESYWRARIPHMPLAPELPVRPVAGTPQFERWSMSLAESEWTELKRRAAELHITPSAVLMAAYADVIGTFSKRRAMTLNVTLFRRLPLHSHINQVVGDFTSLLPLEVDEAPSWLGFDERARRVSSRLWEALDNAAFSGVRVVRELRRVRGADITLPVVFTSTLDLRQGASQPGENAADGARALESHAAAGSGWPTVERVYSVSQTPQVLLDCQVGERAGGVWINWDAVPEAFPPGLVDAMFETFRTYLAALGRRDASWNRLGPAIAEADLGPRRSANSTAEPIATRRLHEGFFDWARRTPDALAVAGKDYSLSYAELAGAVGALSRRLSQQVSRPGARVGIVMQKGWEQVAAALAIVSCGCAYVPIDVSLPEERLRYVIENASVDVVVVQRARSLALERFSVPVVIFEDVAHDRAAPTAITPFTDESLAYVIYTSGSTGFPKGVMISHRAAMNTIAHINRVMEVSAGDRVLALSSLSFDLSVFDIFGVLSAGGALVLPESGEGRAPDKWHELVKRWGVTLWNSVPALLELFVEHLDGQDSVEPLTALRIAMLSGDWLPTTLHAKMAQHLPNAVLWSLGGATEAAIWSIAHRVQEGDRQLASVPYGKPLLNQRFHVLHGDLTPCPTWVAGELYIEGTGLAMGYWSDPAKTAASFVPGQGDGERMYRTGDWGRYLPDGSIELLGRDDAQVKVGGYRIELGEIEATVVRHPDVRAAAVCAPKTASGGRRLAAFVVADPSTDLEQVTAYLHEHLPAYMVPPVLQRLETLPLTANGKVDRRALETRALEAAKGPGGASRAPGRIVEAVQDVVHEVLGVRVQEHDNLFEVGADSIGLVRLTNAMHKRFGVRPSLANLFREPSVANLAHFVETSAVTTDSAASAPAGGLSSWMQAIADDRQSDPVAVDELKRQRFQLLDNRHAESAVELRLSGPPPEALHALHARRRTHRMFAAARIEQIALGRLLGVARRIQWNGSWKYRYASAGGIYPIIAYLTVREDRVEGLTQGTYFYDSREHALRRISDYFPEESCYGEGKGYLVNRPVFLSSALGVILVAEMSTVSAVYGQRGLLFAALEAGELAHSLELEAAEVGLGACQIGHFAPDAFATAVKLSELDVVVHHLLFGVAAENEGAARDDWDQFEV